MRAVRMVLVVALFGLWMGCQQIEDVLNPRPTTSGSRVSEKLRELPRPDPANIKTVTVYRFQNKAGFPHGLAISNGMTDQLITALVKSGHFKVVERAELGDVMTEKRLQRSGEATGDAGKTKLVGAQLIFKGAITEMDQTGGGGIGVRHGGVGLGLQTWAAQVGLDMRIVNAGTGVVIDSIDVRRKVRKTGMRAAHKWGVAGNVKISNALDLAIRETLEEAVFQLVTKFGAAGRTGG